jgi:hypothetical protein
LWAGTGADYGRQDLLEALGGGDFFDGFEILFPSMSDQNLGDFFRGKGSGKRGKIP